MTTHDATHDVVRVGRVTPSIRSGPERRRDVWRDGPTRRFLLSQAAGQFADALTAMILARVVLSTSTDTPDPAALLRTLAVAIGPYAVVGPIAGVIADRWDRRWTLAVANVGRAAATVLAVVAVRTHDQVSGLVAAGVLLSLARVVFTLRAASLPCVSPAGLLVRVDSASLYTGMSVAVVGGSLGALGAIRIPSLLLFLAVGCQLVSAAGFASLRCDLGGRAGERAGSIGSTLRRIVDGATSRAIRGAIGVTATHRALLGATFVSLVMLAGEHLGPAKAYGATLAITGFGTFVGASTAPDWCDRIGVRRAVVVAFALPAVAAPLAATWGRPIPIVLAVAATFLVFQHVRVLADATVQADVRDDVRGRVFSIYDASYNVSYLGGAATAIVLGVAGAPHLALITIGAAYAIGAAALALRLPIDPTARVAHAASSRR